MPDSVTSTDPKAPVDAAVLLLAEGHAAGAAGDLPWPITLLRTDQPITIDHDLVAAF